MSVLFMLSIDYLDINAHPRLPPTRLGLRVSGYACACYALTGRSGFGYYFHFTPGLTPWAIELTAPPVGGARNSARLRLAKFQFIEMDGAIAYKIFGTRACSGLRALHFAACVRVGNLL